MESITPGILRIAYTFEYIQSISNGIIEQKRDIDDEHKDIFQSSRAMNAMTCKLYIKVSIVRSNTVVFSGWSSVVQPDSDTF